MKTLDGIKKLNTVKKADGTLLIEAIDLKELKGAKEKDLAEAFLTAIEGIPEKDEQFIPEELAELYNKLAETEPEPEVKPETKPVKAPAKPAEKKAPAKPAEKKAPEKPAEKKAPEKMESQSSLMNRMLKEKADHKIIIKALVKITGKDETWAAARLKGHINWQKTHK